MSVNILNEKLKIHRSFVQYFGDINMTKMKEIQSGDHVYSLYYAKVGCMLCIETQYLIAVISGGSQPVGHISPLSRLNWLSFQSRIMDDPPGKLHSQTIKDNPTELMSSPISLVDKKIDRCVYISENIPIKVELLFTKDDDNYSSFGTLKSALDTYNCVVSFTL